MRGFKNFKDSDARCPSINFLFYRLHYVIHKIHEYSVVSINITYVTGNQQQHTVRNCQDNN